MNKSFLRVVFYPPACRNSTVFSNIMSLTKVFCQGEGQTLQRRLVNPKYLEKRHLKQGFSRRKERGLIQSVFRIWRNEFEVNVLGRAPPEKKHRLWDAAWASDFEVIEAEGGWEADDAIAALCKLTKGTQTEPDYLLIGHAKILLKYLYALHRRYFRRHCPLKETRGCDSSSISYAPFRKRWANVRRAINWHEKACYSMTRACNAWPCFDLALPLLPPFFHVRQWMKI
jgi:hypothetical protein